MFYLFYALASLLPLQALAQQLPAYDYVIVGAGTTGLLLAVALSENPNVTVAVLEAGADGRNDQRITIPEKEGSITNTIFDWNLTSAPQTSLYGGKSIGIARGKVIGGTSAMNWMIWHRSSAVEFNAWQSLLGNPGWNWTSVYTANKQAEHFYDPPASDANVLTYNNAYHGMAGPIHGTMARSYYTLYTDYLLPTLKTLGVPIPLDRDGGNTTGAGFVPLAIDPATYTRSYSGSAYSAVQSRANLHLFTNAMVSRILWKTKTSALVTGNAVEYYNTTANNGVLLHINASQIIISAGALKSPQLLELSGVGDPTVLQPLGITPVVNLTSVGKNLHDHITSVGSFSFNASNFNGSQYTQNFLDLAPASRFLSTTDLKLLNTMLSSTTSPAGISQVDYDFLKHMIAGNQPLVEFGWFLSYVTIYLQHPLSRGTVHVSSSDPFKDPEIDPAYNSAMVNGTAIDLWLLAKSAQYLATTLAASHPFNSIAAKYSVNGSLPFNQFQQQVYQNGLGSGAHFTGGAVMLPRASGGVVDHNLLVYGTNNIRVADCSVIPVSPGQHVMGLAYAVAMRATSILRGL